MAFTTPCFIRKNTPELRKRLSDLGYRQLRCLEGECLVTGVDLVSSISAECFDNKDPRITWDAAGRIDCGDNEELFLALAALRDDTDRYQWFITPEGCWVYNKGYESISEVSYEWHKATPTEIIAHFKQKES